MKKEFNGWYYKCQSADQTLAVIEASHGDSRSVQVICDDGAWSFFENLDGCQFGTDGISLNLEENGVCVRGKLKFSRLTPIKYDIMGPFHYIPLMQCYHSVASMHHFVNGTLTVNGRDYIFDGAAGYIEGDRGRSFPKEYVWTHTFFPEGSLMLSVAHIPFGLLGFTGIISVVMWRGREYRFATYLGARVDHVRDGKAVIRQGKYVLTAKLLKRNALPLAAPVSGQMIRTIHESASCRAFYRLERAGEVLFEFTTDQASFEYEYHK